jgi:lambda family phage portal protein
MDNWLDRLIEPISPQWALKRMHARAVLATYEAAQPSRLRKHRRDQSGPNRLAEKSAVALRTQMRYLERNHDITKGSLDVLVNNTVGPNGIGIEFQPRKMDGTIHDAYAKQLAEAYEEWQRKPEVTHRRDWQNVQRTMARTKFRDGEGFAQQITGPVQYLDHGTRVPYSLELMEADHVPYEYSDTGRGVFNGCERDEWGRVRGWYVYKKHPGEMANLPTLGDLKRIPADRMLQIAELARIGQMRGITPYASVINRIEDIKDYEESERIAAKIAAMMTAYIKRQAPSDEGYTPQVDPVTGQPLKREIGFQPGMVIDTLAVGEEIGLIDTSRPNVNLVHFRNGQLRAFAAGIAASYSSVARNYEGTYSAQRQELVETFVHYAVHTDDFIGQFNRPVIESFITAAHLSGVAKKPGDLKPGTEFDVLYLAPSMPWIDPAKEALAWLTLVKAGFASEVEVIRKRGQSPDSLLEQVDLWRKKCGDKGLTFDSNAGLELLLKEAATDKEAPAEARAQAQAMLEAVRSGVHAMSQREPMAVHVAAPAITVAAPQAPDVKVEHHTHIDNQVDVPPAQVEVQPAGDVHNHIQPSAVVVQPAAQGAYRQVITRDADGEVSQIMNEPVPPEGSRT